MNEKAKKLMNKQILSLVESLTSTFQLPVFEDEVAEDEEESLQKEGYNCFVYETGSFTLDENVSKISQLITVYYYSQNKDDVDEQTLDIITVINKINALSFITSEKQRLQKNDTDQYLDRIILTFKRVIPFDRTV